MSKKKHPEHVNHERWLVSYADFITLLFAFFVVLFASSQADKKKQLKVAHAMQSAFSDMGVFERHSKTPPLADNGAGDADSAARPNPLDLPTRPEAAAPLSALQDAKAIANSAAALKEQSTAGRAAKSLDEVRRDLDNALSKAIGSHAVVVRLGPEGLTISLREAGFFDSGSADIRRSALPLVQSIAAELVATRFNLRIEGHTDNVPIHTAQFDSNWELSTTRSVRIARVFLQSAALDPSRLSAAGYAEFHPVESNASEPGRAHNRRVDIVVLPTGQAR